MGTKVQYKSYIPAYQSMRDLNGDSNNYSWPLYYGNKTPSNGQYHNNGFLSRAMTETCLGNDKDALKRKMLEHEAIFKNQLFELHRIYRIQRELMSGIDRSDIHRKQTPIEAAYSSSPLLSSRVTSENAQKWNLPGLPLSNSFSARFSNSVVEDINSSLSSMNGNNRPTGHLTFQNGDHLKEVEVRESRSTKVRRKMLDLQLPADEYIDSDEEVSGNGMLGCIPNMSQKIGSINGEKNGCLGDFSRSGSSYKNPCVLADLNEVIQLEEKDSSAYVDLHIHASNGEISPKSINASDKEARKSIYIENNTSGRGMLSHVLEAGLSQDEENSISHGLQTEKFPISSQPMQISDKYRQIYNNNHPGPFVVTHISNPYPIAPDLGMSWPNSISSSWEKPSCDLFNKLISIQTQPPCLNSHPTVRTNSHSSAQSNGVLEDRWHHHSDGLRSNGGFGNGIPERNGFHREPPREVEAQPPSSISYGISSKSLKDIDLNMVVTEYFSEEMRESEPEKEEETRTKLPCVNNRELGFVRCSTTNDHFAYEREIRNGSSCILDENVRINSSCLSEKPSSRNLLGFPVFEESYISKNESFSLTSPSVSLLNRSEGEVKDSREIQALGINLPHDPLIPENGKHEPSNHILVDKRDSRETIKVSGFRQDIDLNSCLCLDEPSPRPLAVIDLEIPAVPEIDDVIPERDVEELDPLINVAAEAIVAISFFGSQGHVNEEKITEDSSSNKLDWFVEIILSGEGDDSTTTTNKNNNNGNNNRVSSLEEIDYFESMTLSLKEMKEEEYMPEPLVPENIKFEEEETKGNTLLLNRPRRGQARRGRQKRDFQRDILPGLTSLSRYEVTEDLQTFGGLMRATGYLWHLGLARKNSTRNGCGRGRRKSVAPTSPPPGCVPPLIQQLTNVEMGLEDQSFTGWGKMTRRPRRQRGRAGNPPPNAT